MDWKSSVTFGGAGLDRAAHLRSDPPAGGVLPMWHGKPLIDVRDGARSVVLIEASHDILGDAVEPPVFLGLDQGQPVYACDVSAWPGDEDAEGLGGFLDASEQKHPTMPDHHVFGDLRANLALLGARSLELAATAKGLLSWHSTHQFCAKCGNKSDMAEAGWQRNCPACGGKHFPRTDPVVIMLILSGNSVLVGRSPFWPEGMYSLLAGFVEPGETLEAAVRREVYEEAGIQVGAVDYLVSQPWPFPSSLMFGCIGRAESTEINIDPVEIEDAVWVSKEEMAEVFRGTHKKFKSPRKGAVARYLLEAWLRDLPGTRI